MQILVPQGRGPVPGGLRAMSSVHLNAEPSPHSISRALGTKAFPEGDPSSTPELPEAPASGEMKRDL